MSAKSFLPCKVTYYSLWRLWLEYLGELIILPTQLLPSLKDSPHSEVPKSLILLQPQPKVQNLLNLPSLKVLKPIIKAVTDGPLSVINPGAWFLSICTPGKLEDKLSAPKYSLGTGIQKWFTHSLSKGEQIEWKKEPPSPSTSEIHPSKLC